MLEFVNKSGNIKLTKFKLQGLASSNLIWRVISEDEILVEERIVGDIRPGLAYTVTYSFSFGSNAEGVSEINNILCFVSANRKTLTSLV